MEENIIAAQNPPKFPLKKVLIGLLSLIIVILLIEGGYYFYLRAQQVSQPSPCRISERLVRDVGNEYRIAKLPLSETADAVQFLHGFLDKKGENGVWSIQKEGQKVSFSLDNNTPFLRTSFLPRGENSRLPPQNPPPDENISASEVKVGDEVVVVVKTSPTGEVIAQTLYVLRR